MSFKTRSFQRHMDAATEATIMDRDVPFEVWVGSIQRVRAQFSLWPNVRGRARARKQQWVCVSFLTRRLSRLSGTTMGE